MAMVDASTIPAKGHVEVMCSRSPKVLIPIIEYVVKPGCIVTMDDWKDYNHLNDNIDCEQNDYPHL